MLKFSPVAMNGEIIPVAMNGEIIPVAMQYDTFQFFCKSKDRNFYGK